MQRLYTMSVKYFQTLNFSLVICLHSGALVLLCTLPLLCCTVLCFITVLIFVRLVFWLWNCKLQSPFCNYALYMIGHWIVCSWMNSWLDLYSKRLTFVRKSLQFHGFNVLDFVSVKCGGDRGCCTGKPIVLHLFCIKKFWETSITSAKIQRVPLLVWPHSHRSTLYVVTSLLSVLCKPFFIRWAIVHIAVLRFVRN